MKIYQYAGKSNICGDNIRKFRKRKKISQSDLAARLQSKYGIQVEQKAISRLEAGQRFIADYEMLAISRILGVSIEQLYCGSYFDSES